MRNARWMVVPGIVVAVIAVLAGGCAYQLGTTLPSDLRSIFIPTFVNKSGEPQLEIDTTRATITEFQKEGNLKVMPTDQADLVLTVTLTGLKMEPVRFENDNVKAATEYRVTLSADISVKKVRTGEVILKRSVSGDTTTLYSGDTTSTKRAAMPLASRDLALKIVDAVVEYW